MAGEDSESSGERPQQPAHQPVNGHSAVEAAAALRSPSRKRRKSDSAQPLDGAVPADSPPSAAATASSLNALADATVSLGSAAAPSGPANAAQSASLIERMQRQLEAERGAREAAESEKRRLEEHVQRLEQNSKHAAQQHSLTHSPDAAPHSAPATPAHHTYAVPAANINTAATTAAPTAQSLSSSAYLVPSSSLDGVPQAARGVLAADLGKLFPSVSASVAADDDSDERGVSCHQCKSNKPKHLLLFCTTKADSTGRKRRCRKKYCQPNSHPTRITHSAPAARSGRSLPASV